MEVGDAPQIGHRSCRLDSDPYKAAGSFSADRSRLDRAFHEDLKRVCAAYSGGTKSSRTSTAWTYYQAVRAFR